MPKDTRYCDETCRYTWMAVNMSRLSQWQMKVLEKHGIGFSMTEEQIDAVLERLKKVKTGV